MVMGSVIFIAITYIGELPTKGTVPARSHAIINAAHIATLDGKYPCFRAINVKLVMIYITGTNPTKKNAINPMIPGATALPTINKGRYWIRRMARNGQVLANISLRISIIFGLVDPPIWIISVEKKNIPDTKSKRNTGNLLKESAFRMGRT
jgi:hypothetical protein